MVRRNIMLIIPELGLGGAQRSVSKLSAELAKHHDVWLVVFDKNVTPKYEFSGELISLDVKTGNALIVKLHAFRERIRKLRALKKKLNIDVSISFLEGADYVNVLSKSREKIVLSVRGSKKFDDNITGENYGRIRHSLLIPFLYQRADRIVAVSKGIANELSQQYKLTAPVHVIGNYYDCEAIRLKMREPRSPAIDSLFTDPVVVTTGRLSREKGLLEIIDIFKLLKQRIPTIRWLIVGDGPLSDKIIAKCNEVELIVRTGETFDERPDVVLVGSQPNVFKFLRNASLYLMNSSNEGFPNGIAEAMICGVPVVSSDCPYGPREILSPALTPLEKISYPYNGQGGVLLPVVKHRSDVTLWASTIKDLMAQIELRKSILAKGADRVKSFDHSRMYAEWNSVIELLFNKSKDLKR